MITEDARQDKQGCVLATTVRADYDVSLSTLLIVNRYPSGFGAPVPRLVIVTRDDPPSRFTTEILNIVK